MATTLAERMKKFSGSPTSALIAKVAELKRQGKDIISLNVGEPDFWNSRLHQGGRYEGHRG